MLPSRHRLRREEDVRLVRRTGKRYHGSFFQCYVRFTDTGKPIRVGIIVSKKVSKKAVERNRIARQTRGWVEEHLSSLSLGRDVLLVALKTYSEYDRKIFSKELSTLFQQSHLLP